jgi:hypothetical protein
MRAIASIDRNCRLTALVFCEARPALEDLWDLE